MIRLTVEGVVYEFDDNRLLLAEAREIKTLTGMSPAKMFAGLEEADPDSIAAVIFLAKKRAGETLRFSDLGSLSYSDVNFELLESADSEGEAQQAAPAGDPTPPSGSGTTPTDGTTATLPPSPTTSSTPPPASGA